VAACCRDLAEARHTRSTQRRHEDGLCSLLRQRTPEKGPRVNLAPSRQGAGELPRVPQRKTGPSPFAGRSSLFAGHSGRAEPYRFRSWTRSRIARSSRRVAARAAVTTSPTWIRASRYAGDATSDSIASSPPISSSWRPAASQPRSVVCLVKVIHRYGRPGRRGGSINFAEIERSSTDAAWQREQRRGCGRLTMLS
jgi:hypothetical protein